MGERARWKQDIFPSVIPFPEAFFWSKLGIFRKGNPGSLAMGFWASKRAFAGVFMHMCEMVCKRRSVCLCTVWVFGQTWVSKVLMLEPVHSVRRGQTDMCGWRPCDRGLCRSLGLWLMVDLVGDETVLSGLEVGFVQAASRRWSSHRHARTPDRRPLRCLLGLIRVWVLKDLGDVHLLLKTDAQQS